MKVSKIASQALCSLVSLSMVGITPLAAYADSVDNVLNAASVSQGDTASAKPSVESICTALDNAKNGNFVDGSGKELNIVDPTCAQNYTYRPDAVKNCSRPLSAVIKEAQAQSSTSDIDTLCQGGTNLTKSLQTYCILRTVSKNSQAIPDCEAYKSYDHSAKGLFAMLAIDGSAAGICWAEYLSLQALEKSGSAQSMVEAAGKSGPCSVASIGAGMAEITNIIVANTGSNNHATGNFSIDSNGNVNKKSFNVTQLADIVLGAGLSVAVLRNGICQNKTARKGADGLLGPEGMKKICGVANSTYANGVKSKDDAKNDLANAQKDLADAKTALAAASQGKCQAQKNLSVTKAVSGYAIQGMTQAPTCQAPSAAIVGQAQERLNQANQAVIDAQKAMTTADGSARSQAKTALQPRIDITRSSAMMLTALAGIRGISLALTNSGKNKTRDMLESMFDPTNSTTTMSPAGMTAALPNLFASSSSEFAVTTKPSTTQSSAVTADSPESLLTPPGTPLHAAATDLASKLPSAAIEKATSAEGLGNLVSGAAMAAGATDSAGLNQIKAQVGSIFANLPKEEGGYNGGVGGGRGLASHKDSGGGDLSLKSLFGGGDQKDDSSPGRTDVAFRSPAQEEDIWHSQNLKGNNLFQIVSDKYDVVQRKSGVGPGL